MKIPFKLLHILFIVIAVISIVACFPKLFISENVIGEQDPFMLNVFSYFNAIGRMKLDVIVFLEMWGVAGSERSNIVFYIPTLAIAISFLVAAFLIFSKKTKNVIRILKVGAMLIVTNSLGALTILIGQILLTKKSTGTFLQENQGAIYFSIVYFIGIIFLSYYYFKQLNDLKDVEESNTANLKLEDSIFSDINTIATATFVEASVGKRAINYLIDFVFMITTIVGIVLILFALFLDLEEISNSNKFLLYIGAAIASIFYYTILEKLFGVTIGKMVTNTRVVQSDGTPITWSQAFIRSVSRCVPFEWLSTFGGYPWHDNWSNTYVVIEDKEYLSEETAATTSSNNNISTSEIIPTTPTPLQDI